MASGLGQVAGLGNALVARPQSDKKNDQRDTGEQEPLHRIGQMIVRDILQRGRLAFLKSGNRLAGHQADDILAAQPDWPLVLRPLVERQPITARQLTVDLRK